MCTQTTLQRGGVLSAAASPTRQSHRPWAYDLLYPLLVAVGLRLLLLFAADVGPSWDGVIYVRAAGQLARGEGYTLRILADSNTPQATAFYPVGLPALLALLRMLGGGLWADRLFQIAASTLLVPLSYLLARRTGGRRAGRLAAWFSALWPGGIVLSATWLAEPVFAAGVAASLLPLAYARRRRRLLALALSALGLGLAAYVRPSALPIAACVGLGCGFLWLRRQPPLRRCLGAGLCAAITVAIACAPLAPWLVRNQRALGAPVLVSSNGGVNLLLGALGDGSFANIDPGNECMRAPVPEVQRNRCYERRALEVIASNPLAWFGRALLKLAHTFGHDSAAAQCFSEGLRGSETTRTLFNLWSLGLCRLSWLALLAAALAGAQLVAARPADTARVLLFAPIVAIAGLHMVYLGGDRYHAAVAPMMLALAAVAFARRKRSDAALRPSGSTSHARLVQGSDA